MTSGTGIKNKLLEAMATGLPAVATTLALQGLTAEDGRELLVADTAVDFATAVLRLLESDDEAKAVGAAARRYVLVHHDWEAVGRAYETVYEEVRSGAG
jgi:glycosyltransferase involved in cell wall biosynthesis